MARGQHDGIDGSAVAGEAREAEVDDTNNHQIRGNAIMLNVLKWTGTATGVAGALIVAMNLPWSGGG